MLWFYSYCGHVLGFRRVFLDIKIPCLVVFPAILFGYMEVTFDIMNPL